MEKGQEMARISTEQKGDAMQNSLSLMIQRDRFGRRCTESNQFFFQPIHSGNID